LVKIGIIAIVALLGVTLFFVVIKAIVGAKISNKQLENVMLRAARRYVENNPEGITKDIYGETSLSIDKLSSAGYMKTIVKYKGKDTNCKGSVTVFKNANNYSYSPKLSCGKEYSYKNLKDVITSSKNIVTSGNGLYKNEQSNYYVFKGEYVNNYVNFANQTWRILRVDSNGNIVLLLSTPVTYVTWDDRYNINVDDTTGLNLFEGIENSRIKNSILDYYNDEKNLSSLDKSIIIPTQTCIGTRPENATDKTGASECSVKSELMGASIPYVSELLDVSIDPNCLDIYSSSCSNYNYLIGPFNEMWTSTPFPGDTYNVYFLYYGNFKHDYASRPHNMNIKISVNGNVNFTSGDGTEANPYLIKAIG
jgi:hypothetical protein